MTTNVVVAKANSVELVRPGPSAASAATQEMIRSLETIMESGEWLVIKAEGSSDLTARRQAVTYAAKQAGLKVKTRTSAKGELVVIEVTKVESSEPEPEPEAKEPVKPQPPKKATTRKSPSSANVTKIK